MEVTRPGMAWFFLVAPILGCAGNLEDGRSNLPEHTAGWAAAEAGPVAREWADDAGLVWISSAGQSVEPDGTTPLWQAMFRSESAGGKFYEVDVGDGLNCDDGWCTEWDDGQGVEMNGWRMNSDELAASANFVAEDDILNQVFFSSASFAREGLTLGADAVSASALTDDAPVALSFVGNTTTFARVITYFDARSGQVLYSYSD